MWLSEIILQQTRVDQGLPYWEQFMETFPSVRHLANAPEEKVLRLWQGLGYYSRARNLHLTAKHVSEKLDGQFPSTYDEIIKLKGVGPYTSAAIASICFDEPTPVVDGNVFRFASRYFGIKDDISKSGSRKVFERKLEKEISQNHPGTFNQAMMEFGATICAPKPQCDNCVFQLGCYAFENGLQTSLPKKTGKTKVRDRKLHYIVFKDGDKLFLNERTSKDVWSGLFDFYLIEGENDEESVIKEVTDAFGFSRPVMEEISEPFIHILSHQKINARFYQVSISNKDLDLISQKSTLKAYSIEEVLNLPKPKLIVNYLQRIGIE